LISQTYTRWRIDTPEKAVEPPQITLAVGDLPKIKLDPNEDFQGRFNNLATKVWPFIFFHVLICQIKFGHDKDTTLLAVREIRQLLSIGIVMLQSLM
jgi:hypothetical protein